MQRIILRDIAKAPISGKDFSATKNVIFVISKYYLMTFLCHHTEFFSSHLLLATKVYFKTFELGFS